MTLQGRHVLFALLGFFGLVALVNGVMIYFAVADFPGLETDHAYRRGLGHNDVLAAAATQAARGWTTDITYRRPAGRDLRIRLSVRDARAVPVTLIAAEASLRRPVHDRSDLRAPLQADGDGGYSARFADVPSGQWRLSIVGSAGDGAPYRAESRLWLR